MRVNFSNIKKMNIDPIGRELLLNIEQIDKKIIKIKANELDSVSSVLAQLNKYHNVSDKFSLVFRFKELDPSRTLKSYLIGTESRGSDLKLCVFERRDILKKIEKYVQHLWEREKTFEVDAPQDLSQPKFMATFPFPYVNGLLHCGHGFSLTKAEFASGFQRLQGKRVLFPFGFHCTGMPIVASANKLRKEIEIFGNPPIFEKENTSEQNLNVGKEQKIKKKGKLAGKQSAKLHQFEIMRELGIPETQISDFIDPLHWVRYFTPKCEQHLRRFGCKIDRRRSFVTTELNPFFSRFVEWQFRELERKKLVRFGKRMCVFSPADGQPCADHDRASGEGVQPQEYTAVKMRVIDEDGNKRDWMKILEENKRNIFLIAGTLRPETMYGQTNCFVKPNGDYIAFETKDQEVFVCSEQSAKNMSFQGVTKEKGKLESLTTIKGWDLLGLKVNAPNSVYNSVYVLPLLSISMTKATAVVTSVPSDSPDDYINYIELQKNKAYREKYKIGESMVAFDIVPIIEIEGVGNLAAAQACQKFKVKSPTDEKNLKEAKAETYLKGYYKGKMLVGPHKGHSVETAKEKIKKELILSKSAFAYFEPAETVISRSGDICVVAETSQWFLHYGEEPFKTTVLNYVKNEMEFYSEDTRARFIETIEWMHQWACSRKFGLGTKLPFDQDWMIESLSDSTLYMAYYTISQYLESCIVERGKDKKLAIDPRDLTDQVFEFIFKDGPEPTNLTNLKISDLQNMRNEFRYWYPMDLRVSGKDLINNHLVMCIYNHAFLFQKELWPRSMFANGHTMINAEKMSKSTGNFMTLIECIEQYSADATRLTFADAGDSLDDANFAPETCNAAIIRLTKELSWIREAWSKMGNSEAEFLSNGESDTVDVPITSSKGIGFRNEEQLTFLDACFDNEINQAIRDAEQAYKELKFRVALNKGFYFLCSSKNSYTAMCGIGNLNKKVVLKYINAAIVITAPICSHWSEFLWRLIGREGSVFTHGRWPVVESIDPLLTAKSQFLRETCHFIRTSCKDLDKKNKKTKSLENKKYQCHLIVRNEYPPLKRKVISLISSYAVEKNIQTETCSENCFTQFSKDVVFLLKKEFGSDKKAIKEAMIFASFLLKESRVSGNSKFELNTPFDQKKLLEEHITIVSGEFKEVIEEFVITEYEEVESLSHELRQEFQKRKVNEKACPGKTFVVLLEL